MNGRVKKWVKLFNGNLRPSFKKWIKRLGYYGPTISEILRQEKVPQDLIYLAMIESGFNATATSHASAVGHWQFISSTGRLYGLKNGFFTDDRRDLIKATQAAARHLKDLYKVYGNWYLAFAAYNAGPGKVNRAIKRGRTKNYWRLSTPRSRHLRQETKDYVPKILAAMHIVKNYRRYGYSYKSFGAPMQYERVTVPDASDVKVIAKSAKTNTHVISLMNPALVLGITPPGKTAVYVPKGAAEEFHKNYSSIPSSQRVSHLRYSVGYRETVSSIAKKYSLSAKKIARANKIRSTRKRLKVGTVLKIPVDKRTLLSMANRSAKDLKTSKKRRKKTRTFYYKVRPGDSLSRIARKNHVSTRKLAKWNRIKRSSRLRVGQKLKIYKKSRGYSSGGGFLASYKKSKLSGVDHIIIQDAKTNKDYKPKKKNKDDTQDFPDLVAKSSTKTEDEFHQPGTIHTPTGKTINLTKKKKIKNNDEQPGKIVASAKKTRKKTSPKYHVIKPGETLSDIAVKYDLKLSELKNINHLNSNRIRANQKLLVKKTTTPVKRSTTYTIKSGDSLYAIALRNKTTVSKLKALNNLKSNYVRAGQKIKLTGRVATSSKTVASQKANTKNNSKQVIYHKIKPGETLWSLSRRYNVKISDIMKWNKMKNAQVKQNQKIKIIALRHTASSNALL
jgi:membrane-bound lytic murein transglycosylase D